VATSVSAGALSCADWQPAKASKAVPITAENNFVFILMLLGKKMDSSLDLPGHTLLARCRFKEE
jgi:hypothetical protein